MPTEGAAALRGPVGAPEEGHRGKVPKDAIRIRRTLPRRSHGCLSLGAQPSSRRLKKVQMRGGEGGGPPRRTLCTLSGCRRPRQRSRWAFFSRLERLLDQAGEL